MTPALAELIERLDKAIPFNDILLMNTSDILTLIAAIREREDALQEIVDLEWGRSGAAQTPSERVARRVIGED